MDAVNFGVDPIAQTAADFGNRNGFRRGTPN